MENWIKKKITKFERNHQCNEKKIGNSYILKMKINMKIEIY